MKSGWVVEEVCKFTLPSIPSSINQLYQISFAQKKVFMNPDARIWKSQMKLIIPKIKPHEDSHFFKIDRYYYYNFFYKNGKVKKIDTFNLDKLLIDAISEKCGFDDSLVKFGETESYHSEKERIEIVVSRAFEPKS